MRSFRGKVAAITGAGSGIGRALALELARRGAHLALSDVNATTLAEAASVCESFGGRVTASSVDVAQRDAVYAWAAQVAREHGKVNLIFNNAGVALATTLEGVSHADFEWLMNIDFWGVVHGTQAFLPHLRASSEGHVVNISSVFGLTAAPLQGVYNAAKFAVRGFTEALRLELELTSAAVSATCVHPGGIQTNIARDARYSSSMTSLAVDEQATRRAFESFFITSPESAAKTILRGVQRNRRRVLVGVDAHALDLLVRLAPALAQRSMLAMTKRLVR